MEQENATESEAVFWRGSFGSVLTFIFTILVAWIVFKLYRVLGTIVMMLREVFLFWNITFSSSSHHLPKPLRLHTYICETSYLDEVGVNELYQFLKEDFESSTVTAEDLHKIFLKYTHIMMCRDRVDGTLRGVMTIGVEHRGDYTLIALGITTFKNYYRGSPFLNITIAGFFFRELLRHPLTPVYFIGKLYSYKAYLFVADLNGTYPRYDRETPDRYKKILDEFAETYVKTKGGRAKYNPETNVIEQENSNLAENLTTLPEQDLKNPHVNFFVEKNPGWKKGDMLVAVVHTRWSDILSFAKLILWRILKRRKRSKITAKTQNGLEKKSEAGENGGRKKKAPRPKLLKRYTFQELNANTYAVNNLEYDMTGEVVLSPTTKAPFVFQTITEDSEVNSPGPTEFNIDLPTLT